MGIQLCRSQRSDELSKVTTGVMVFLQYIEGHVVDFAKLYTHSLDFEK